MGLWDNLRIALAERIRPIGNPSTEDQVLSRVGSLASPIFGDKTGKKRAQTFTLDRNSQYDYDEMEKDPTVAIAAEMRVQALASVDFTVSGPDPEVAAYVEEVIKPHWNTIVRSCVRTGTLRGSAPHELVWERATSELLLEEDAEPVTVDGWRIAKLKPIQPLNVYAILVDGSENFAGYKVVTPGAAELHVEDGACFHFSHNGRWANYYGEGDLARIARHWNMKRVIEEQFIRAMGNWASPIPAVGYPVGKQPDGTDNAVIALDLAQTLRGDEPVAAYPNTGTDGQPTGWEVGTFGDGKFDGIAAQYVEALTYCNNNIMRGLLMPEKVVSSDGTTGTYALSETHADSMQIMLEGALEEVLSAVNKQLVPLIVGYTFGADTALPTVEAHGTSDAKQMRLMQLLEMAIRAGLADVDWSQVAESVGLPVAEIESGSTANDVTDPSEGTSAIDMSEAILKLAERNARDELVKLAETAQKARLAAAVAS